MPTQPKIVEPPELGNEAPATTNPVTPADPFDLGSQRVSQNFAELAGVKKLLTTVPVRKPHKQDFVRVHPAEDYRINLHTITLEDDREVYVVRRELYPDLSNELVTVTLFTAITRQGVLHLWPVRLPSPDDKTNAWWTSARAAAEQAMTKWVRLSANLSLAPMKS